MFSIIIPLYNKAPYIEKAIRSVLAQTYKEFELIVVNDGSTDNSGEIVQNLFKKCQDDGTISPPLGGLRGASQPNAGVSVARNNGVKLAKYDYIAFLDADDWWEPTFLEEMKNLIEEFPEAGIYGAGYYIVKNGQKRIAPIGVEPDFEKGLIDYCKVYAKTLCMPLTSISVIMSKSVFKSDNGFKPNLKLGEDFDLWVRVALKHLVAFLNKSLANYNQDVEIQNRAVGTTLYKPVEHMLFTDYSEFRKNQEFNQLFEKLAVYGLLPYYLARKNKEEVNRILETIHWKNHAFKYRLYYRFFPRFTVLCWYRLLKIGSKIKTLFA